MRETSAEHFRQAFLDAFPDALAAPITDVFTESDKTGERTKN